MTMARLLAAADDAWRRASEDDSSCEGANARGEGASQLRLARGPGCHLHAHAVETWAELSQSRRLREGPQPGCARRPRR